MTGPLSSIGTESEASSVVGQGPNCAQPGGKLGIDPFPSSSASRTAGSFAAAPSFLSSCHAEMDAWLGVSRGTNSINNLEEETGTTSGINLTQSALTPNKLQKTCGTMLTGRSPNNSVARRAHAVKTPLAASNCPLGDLGQNGRAQLLSAGAALSEVNLSGACRQTTRESRTSQQKNESVESTVAADQKDLQTLSVSAAELQVLTPSHGVATKALVPEANSPEAFISPQVVPAGPIALRKDGASSAAEVLRTDPHTSMREATRELAPGTTSLLSPSGVPEHIRNMPEISASSGGSPNSEPDSTSQRASERETLRTSGEDSGNRDDSVVNVRHFAASKISAGEVSFASSHDLESGISKAITVEPQVNSSEIAASPIRYKRAHGTAWKSTAIATPIGAAQSGSVGATDETVQAPASVHRPVIPVEAGVIGSISSPASAQDPFIALDRETSVGNPAWTHVAGQHAEAGFRDPQLGWVGVRADLNASGIHASLVPSSEDAAQALSGHLAGLTSHLVEEHASLASLFIAEPKDTIDGYSAGQHMEQGSGGNAQGWTSEQPQTTAPRGVPLEPRNSERAAFATGSVAQETRLYPGDLRGTRISVIA